MDKTYLLGLVVLLGLVKCGSSIMCYECNSATNMQCHQDKLPDSLKRNCSEHDRGDIRHTLCRKIVQHIDVEVNNEPLNARIIRSCGWDDSKYKRTCYHRSGYGSRHEVCSCTTDFCNSSEHLEPKTSLLAVVMMATAKMLA